MSAQLFNDLRQIKKDLGDLKLEVATLRAELDQAKKPLDAQIVEALERDFEKTLSKALKRILGHG